MKIYKKFNETVHNNFFNEKFKGEYIILSVDDDFINTFCDNNKIDRTELFFELQELFGINWSVLFKSDSPSIPNYFGFIAFQIYIAHLMHKDGDYSANAYNPRLLKRLKIQTENRLQSLYQCYQDKMWHKLKTWCCKNDFYINIPQKKSGAGRYTQYPLSQALLNKEDLKKLPLLFDKVGIRSFELLNFKDFCGIISNGDTGNIMSNHYYKIKNKLSLNDCTSFLKQQIFSFYAHWDGKIPTESKTSKTAQGKDRKDSNNILVMTNDFSYIRIYDKIDNVKFQHRLSEKYLFEKISKKYRLPHKEKNLILFIKDEDYNEWKETRYFDFNSPCLFLFKNENNYFQDYIHMLDNDYQNYSTPLYSIYQLKINSDHSIPNLYKCFFSKSEKPFSEKNGLKISRKTWMHEAGPDFFFKEPVQAWLNGKQLNIDGNNPYYSCRDLDSGEYSLKIANHAPFTFYIQYPNYKEANINSGWHVKRNPTTWEPCKENYTISGFWTDDHAVLPNSDIDSKHRKWINTILLKKTTEKRSDPLIIKALKRAQYVK